MCERFSVLISMSVMVTVTSIHDSGTMSPKTRILFQLNGAGIAPSIAPRPLATGASKPRMRVLQRTGVRLA
jgi:hypothetical protein